MTATAFAAALTAAIAALVAAVTLPARAQTDGGGDPDAAIYARIRQYRAVASKVRIDGDAGDWAGMPSMTDRRPIAGSPIPADPHRRIVRIAIAVRDDDLLVLLRTAARPLPQDWAYGIELQLSGPEERDVVLLAGVSRPHKLYVRGESPSSVAAMPRPIMIPKQEIAVRIGAVIEMRIPFRALMRALPPALAAAIVDRTNHPWLRVFGASWDGVQNGMIDDGPSIASYRLLAAPYNLDPPLPRGDPAAAFVTLPVIGQWYLCEGPFRGTHAGKWAYDLSMVDEALFASLPPGSHDNGAYYCWSQPILSPGSGTVLQTQTRYTDHPPGKLNPALQDRANAVCLDVGRGYGFELAHLRQGSIPSDIRAGGAIVEGTVVGVVGDTGYSTAPHLHISAFPFSDIKATVPLALLRVRVSLNPGDDPWKRDLPSWQPREGYFVERLP